MWSSRNSLCGPGDAGISVHSAVCVVNSKAADTMRNTPVRMYYVYYDRVPNMAGRGSGVPWTTPRKRRCTTGSSTSRCGQCWTSRGTMWRCPSLPARLSPWTWLGGVDACIRRAGKAEAGTKGYGAYWRPLTRWSGFTPGDAVEHRHAATGEDTAGEEEGGRRRGEGSWPCGREPVTVFCRATFLMFLIHQRVDAGLLWRFPGGTRGCEPPPSSRSECSRRPLCPAGSCGPRADLARMLAGGVASRCVTEALRLFLEAMFPDPRSRVRAQTCRVATAAAFEYRTPARDGDGLPGQSAARRAVEGCFPAVLGMCGSGAGPTVSHGRECLRSLAWGKGGDVHDGRGGRIVSMVSHTAA